MDKFFTFRLQELPGYLLILAAVTAGILMATKRHKPWKKLSHRQKKARIAWIAAGGAIFLALAIVLALSC